MRVPVYLDADGAHLHRCAECGTEWRHVQDLTASREEYSRLHACPGCGADQRKREPLGHEDVEDEAALWIFIGNALLAEFVPRGPLPLGMRGPPSESLYRDPSTPVGVVQDDGTVKWLE